MWNGYFIAILYLEAYTEINSQNSRVYTGGSIKYLHARKVNLLDVLTETSAGYDSKGSHDWRQKKPIQMSNAFVKALEKLNMH